MTAPGQTATATPPAAIVLAAGLGRRLGGRPKAALRIGGTSLLERQLHTLRAAGIRDLGVVIGPYADALAPLAERAGARVIRHPDRNTPGAPDLVASQRLALRSHLQRHRGTDLLLVLADLPALQPDDIRPLLDAWWRRPADVLAQRPVVNGVQGHPLLLAWSAALAVDALPGHLGVRDLLAGAPAVLQTLPSDRSAYVTDLDTPQDLAALRARCHPLKVDWPAPWQDSA